MIVVLIAGDGDLLVVLITGDGDLIVVLIAGDGDLIVVLIAVVLNGDLWAVAHFSGVLEAAVIWYKIFHFIS